MAFSLFAVLTVLGKVMYVVCVVLYVCAFSQDYWVEFPGDGHAGLWVQCGLWRDKNATSANNSVSADSSDEMEVTTSRTSFANPYGYEEITPRRKFAQRTTTTTSTTTTTTTTKPTTRRWRWRYGYTTSSTPVPTSTTVKLSTSDTDFLDLGDHMELVISPSNNTGNLTSECRFFNIFTTPVSIHATRLCWLVAVLGVLCPLRYGTKLCKCTTFALGSDEGPPKKGLCATLILAIVGLSCVELATTLYKEDVHNMYGSKASLGPTYSMAETCFTMALITVILFVVPPLFRKHMGADTFHAWDRNPLEQLRRLGRNVAGGAGRASGQVGRLSRRLSGRRDERPSTPPPAPDDDVSLSGNRSTQSRIPTLPYDRSLHASRTLSSIYLPRQDPETVVLDLDNGRNSDSSIESLNSTSDPAPRYDQLVPLAPTADTAEPDDQSALPPPPSYDEYMRGGYSQRPSDNTVLSPLLMPSPEEPARSSDTSSDGRGAISRPSTFPPPPAYEDSTFQQ